METFTPSYACSDHGYVLVRIIVWLVIVVVTAITVITVIVAVTVHVIIHVLIIGRIVVIAAYIGLFWIEQANRQWVGTFASKPWLNEGDAVRMVEFTVGLSTDGKCLAVTLGQEQAIIVTLVEQVVHTEIGKLKSRTAYYTCLAPTHWQLYLVISLAFKLPVYINSTVWRVRPYVGIDRGLFKMAHVGNRAEWTLQCIIWEYVTGTRVKFTSYHILVYTVVAMYHYAVDWSLRTLRNTHFKVYGITHHISLDWIYLEQHISLVIIHLANGIIIIPGALIYLFLVIDITPLHA